MSKPVVRSKIQDRTITYLGFKDYLFQLHLERKITDVHTLGQRLIDIQNKIGDIITDNEDVLISYDNLYKHDIPEINKDNAVYLIIHLYMLKHNKQILQPLREIPEGYYCLVPEVDQPKKQHGQINAKIPAK